MARAAAVASHEGLCGFGVSGDERIDNGLVVMQHNGEVVAEACANGPHPRSPVEGIGGGNHVNQTGVVRRRLDLLVKLPVQSEDLLDLAFWRYLALQLLSPLVRAGDSVELRLRASFGGKAGRDGAKSTLNQVHLPDAFRRRPGDHQR